MLATSNDLNSVFKFKHLYTVSDGVDLKYEKRTKHEQFMFKWLHWSFRLDENTILTTDANRVHLFKLVTSSDPLSCTFYKSIDFGEDSDLKGVCQYSPYNKKLCLVDQGTSSVLLIDEEFKIVKKLDFKSASKKRWLYSCDQYDFQIFVLDRTNCSVLVINSNFQFLKEIDIKLPIMFPKKISLREIIVRDDKVYLTDNDHGNRSMHIFDLNFNYIRSFGFGLLHNPYAFLFFKNEYIFVLQHSNTISIFDVKDFKLKATKTLENCESAINGIIINNTIFITSLLTVNLPKLLNENSTQLIQPEVIEPQLTTKIDVYEIN